MCVRHGAKLKRCSSEGCTNQAVNGGVCVKHGAKVKQCSSEGCTKNAQKGGLCRKHGAKEKLPQTEKQQELPALPNKPTPYEEV